MKTLESKNFYFKNKTALILATGIQPAKSLNSEAFVEAIMLPGKKLAGAHYHVLAGALGKGSPTMSSFTLKQVKAAAKEYGYKLPNDFGAVYTVDLPYIKHHFNKVTVTVPSRGGLTGPRFAFPFGETIGGYNIAMHQAVKLAALFECLIVDLSPQVILDYRENIEAYERTLPSMSGTTHSPAACLRKHFKTLEKRPERATKRTRGTDA